jgi:hypothetical protein
MLTVSLSLAAICFTYQAVEECHNVLIGHRTPVGEFQLAQRFTDTKGYGGDVLQFRETDHEVMAIHRVWTLNPEQRRVERLASTDPKQRRFVTNGCINVSPKVYDRLVECCSDSKIAVVK